MARLGPFGPGRRVMVGVSGGADSMALAWLLRRWGAPLACVVDHRLRPESAVEAALTAQQLGAMGVPAQVAVAQGLHPGPALARRARAVRYALLGEACRAAGCVDLLAGHHARDQAETVALREGSGSGPLGLAGMGGITYLGTARLLRPFLPIPPARLRATLQRAGVAWVEDPSNQNLNLPRARMRAAFTAGEIDARCRTAARHGLLRHEREAELAQELAACAAIHPAGYARLRGPVSAAALSALVWTVSGQLHPPPSAAVARLACRLRPATLHGAAIVRSGPDWLLGREAAAMAPPVPAVAGARWDGRYVLGEAIGGATLGAVGEDAARLRRWSGLPAAILRTLPAVRLGEEIRCVPHLDFPDAGACLTVSVLFNPARPVAGTPFGPA